MKLNHINLVVENVANSIHLFETYFNFKCEEIKGDHVIAVLKGCGDFTLVLMKNKKGIPTYPEQFHIGFLLESKESVIETYQNLKSGGLVKNGEPQKIRDSFGFYFTYENLMIEVSHYFEENGQLS